MRFLRYLHCLRHALGSQQGVIAALQFSPSDEYFAVGVAPAERELSQGNSNVDWQGPKPDRPSSTSVKVWSLSTGKEVLTSVGALSATRCMDFSPTSNRFAIAKRGGDIELWDTKFGLQIATIDGDEIVAALAYSPDGQVLAAYRLPSMTTLICDGAPTDDPNARQGRAVAESLR